MAFEIIFLGTGGSVPRNRYLNATLIRGFGYNFLVDCGDGTQYPLLKSGEHLGNNLKILISHEHVDHIGGLGGLLNTLSFRRSARMKIEIYGGSLVLEKILLLLQMVGSLEWLDVHYNELGSGLSWDSEHYEESGSLEFPRSVPREEKPKKWVSDFARELLKGQVIKCDSEVLWPPKDKSVSTKKEKPMSIKYFRTDHTTEESFGFIFEEREKREFLPEKAIKLNVPKGPYWKRLKTEPEVELEDGRIIKQEQVLSPPIKGKKLVLLTDTLFSTDLISHCQGADCLIAEATYLEQDSEEANKNKCLTANQAGILAKKAGVKKMYLNHITERYENTQDILNEAKKVFPNTDLAEDLKKIIV